MTVEELAREIGAEVVGDGSATVLSAATLEDAQPGQVSFLANAKYARQLETTRASAVVVAPSVRATAGNLTLLKTTDPYYAFMKAVVRLHGHRKHPHAGVHPAAHVDPAATIGEGTVVYPGVYVGPRCRVGRDCILYANAVLYEDSTLGDRVIVHAGSVTLGHHVTLAGQTGVSGHLKIGNNVTIGAQSGVISDIDDQSTLVGSPAMPVSHARRVYMYFTQLPDIVDRLKTLEQQVEELSTGGDEGAEVV
jgi:UDP-3-O-[3-hydroxymyristoyl] glucosamine N-acyltransferase